MAEHKVEKLASYCDKILLLHEGKQIAFDTPERIFSRDDLEMFGMEHLYLPGSAAALG